MKRILIRIGLVVVILVLLGITAVFLSLNSIVKKGVETVGPKLTQVDVKLASADISPFSGSGSLSKLFIGNPSGYKTPSAILVGKVKVGVQLTSLASDVIVVDNINVQSAEVTLEGSFSGNNLSRILDNIEGPGKEAAQTTTNAATGKPKKFIVKNFDIEGTKVNLSLNILGGRSLTVPLPPVHVQNIGVAENGVTADQLAAALLKPLLSSAMEAGEDAVKNLGGKIKDFGKSGGQMLQNGVNGVSDLFKK